MGMQSDSQTIDTTLYQQKADTYLEVFLLQEPWYPRKCMLMWFGARIESKCILFQLLELGRMP